MFFYFSPTPEISWRLPSNPPPQSRIDCTKEHNTECFITKLQYTDSGTYRCQGENAEGRGEAKFRLKIECKSTILLLIFLFHISYVSRILFFDHCLNVMNSMQTCNSVTFYFMKKLIFWNWQEVDFAKTWLGRLTRVNSDQRWKQTRFRVCFHLWSELTITISAVGQPP